MRLHLEGHPSVLKGIYKHCQRFREPISSQRSLGSCWGWSLQTGSQLSAFCSYRGLLEESVEERKSGKNSAVDPMGSKKLQVEMEGTGTVSSVPGPSRWKLQSLLVVTLV